MRSRRKRLKRYAHGRRKATQTFEPLLVGGKLRRCWQGPMHKKMRDLLKLTAFGNVENILAAIVQIVAGPADGAQRCVASYDAGKRD
jgi:hypothetical protein